MDTTGNKIDHESLDELRKGKDPVQQHLIDELVAGNLSRRDFLRKATAFGIAVPVAGSILRATGHPGVSRPSQPAVSSRPRAGGTFRAGQLVPAGAINPITIDDQGGLELLGNLGEFLVFTDQHGVYHPWLATSWKANSNATVWTFKIRQGVRFNNGNPMTVDDVVYSFKTQSDPKNSGGNALSVFGGTLVPDGVKKVNDTTVQFHLEQGDGGFIDAVSEDNYNMIIVPNGYDYSNYQTDFVGTGHFKVSPGSYNASTGVTLVRNPHYWGKAAIPSQVQITFYATESPMTAALQSGNIDALDQFSVAESPQLLHNSSIKVIKLKAATHRECSMRNDIHPFTSKYVRQAIAYTLDRPAIVQALFKGTAAVGNDSPFAPNFAATVGPPGVPQRKKDLKKARELLAKGGVSRGFKAHLVTEQLQEVPTYAEIIKASAKAIGVDISLTVESQDKYYGSATFGKSDWLDGEMSIVDYGARAIPNVLLEAPLQSINSKTGSGAWNAARFNNSTYDKLSKEFIAAVDLSSQRKIAKKIELLLLEETPIIYAYFYDYLCATRSNVSGVYPTAQGQYFLWNAKA